MLILAASASAYSLHSLHPVARLPRARPLSMVAAREQPGFLSKVFKKADAVAASTAPPPAAVVEEISLEPSTPVGSVDPTELTKQYDLVVIGGGPAGVAGATKAAQLGKRVLIVDKPKAAPTGGGLDFGFGGPTGLFSKALRDVGKSLDVDSMRAMGLDQDVIWGQVRNNCLRLAGNNANNVCELLSTFRIGYLQGEATLSVLTPYAEQEGKHALTVVQHADGKTVNVTTKKVLLCLGSKPTRVSSIPFDDVRIFDSDSVNSLDFLPQSVIIVGSGIIAIEYAKIFRMFGADVTMLVRSSAMSALERIGLDTTVAERLLKGLADDGIKVMENTQVNAFAEVPGEGCELSLSPFDAIGIKTCAPVVLELDKNKGTLEADVYLAAMGRAPVGKGTSIGLETAGISLAERGHVEVDGAFETSVKGIFAAGDCIEGPALASTGVDQAQRAVAAMFGSASVAASDDFPIGMWTIPEIGYYGLTKDKAIAKGFDAEEGVATYDACLRGRVFAPDGMLKLVFDKESRRILGVHIIGTDACELVHYGMDLVDREATIFDVIGTLFTAVTFHELFKEAALNGNSKLQYGIQWQEVLRSLAIGLPDAASLNQAELRKKFDEIDTSGDGSLDPDELKAVFDGLGESVDPQVIENLVFLADEDGNGTIEWDEFQSIFLVLKEMSVK